MRFLRGVSASQPQLEDQTNRDAWPVGRGGAAKGCGTLGYYFDVHERWVGGCTGPRQTA